MKYTALSFVLIASVFIINDVYPMNNEEMEHQIIAIRPPFSREKNSEPQWVRALFVYNETSKSYYPVCGVKFTHNWYFAKKINYFVKTPEGILLYYPHEHGPIKAATVHFYSIIEYLKPGPQKNIFDVTDNPTITHYHAIYVTMLRANPMWVNPPELDPIYNMHSISIPKEYLPLEKYTPAIANTQAHQNTNISNNSTSYSEAISDLFSDFFL